MTAPIRTSAEIEARKIAIGRLLRPKSVAIVGASENPSSLGRIVLDNLDRFRFPGSIHLVHRSAKEIAGRPCVPTTFDLPEGADCVVLAIPSKGVLEAVKGCAARKVGGVVIFSSGFAESGAEGRAQQEEIAAIAKANNMAIEGPNCVGMINYVNGAPLTFGIAEPSPPTGPALSIVSQSGAMASAIRAAIMARGVEIGISVSTGNEAANGVEDFVEYLLPDPSVTSLIMVAEHFRQPRRFLALAQEARRLGKIIVLLHPGKSSAARKAAETHTGAMTGDHDVMRALVEQAGVLMVETIEELIDVAECIARFKTLPYGGAAIMGESGAFKALMFDYCEELKLPLPQPEGEAEKALAAIAPGLIMAGNPLDMTAQALVDPGLYRKAIIPFLQTKGCGSILLSIILSSTESARRKMPPVIDVLREFGAERAFIFSMLGEDVEVPAEIVDAVRKAGAPFFRSSERALRALARISHWNDRAYAPPSADMKAAQALPAGVMPEYKAKQVLAQEGMPMPQGGMARTLDEALALFAKLKGPVALKAQAAALSHKSDAGGVILNLGSEAALREGWDRLHRNIEKAKPGLTLDGVLVEKMSNPGLELILGARNDPEWGPVLVAGLGGVMAEALKDVRLLAPDASEEQIRAKLKSLNGAKLLGAFRGKPARDINAVVKSVQQLGRFMLAHPEVTEVDINPLLVGGEGEGALPLDALIVAR